MSATAHAQALLFVYGECGRFVTQDQFNDWYDNEHAPLRTTVPGFLTAARYKALDAPPKVFPKWLALYDITSTEVMQSQAYRNLRLKASENEKQVIGNLEVLNRRMYELVESSDASEEESNGSDKTARFIYVVHMQVMKNKDTEQDQSRYKAQEDHFTHWYTSTHIPLLTAVPGYMRSRVFRLIEHTELAGKAAKSVQGNNPFSLLAIHDWSVEGVKIVNSPEFQMYMTDAEPWKMEGEEAVALMEDRLFGLYKVFHKG
ncbi:hypothetical protein J3R30DRAFT_28617 [Lentinula aciculospora]|uniref:EthD domain-containing protein n=1 Tax=Lentinula aciculospora TaxID=153920 RepID=A0A9W9DXW8_9AGAR|nr:hypothetical protein J3R30DRAFT_28617 [Lentinula aciculospora]